MEKYSPGFVFIKGKKKKMSALEVEVPGISKEIAIDSVSFAEKS